MTREAEFECAERSGEGVLPFGGTQGHSKARWELITHCEDGIVTHENTLALGVEGDFGARSALGRCDPDREAVGLHARGGCQCATSKFDARSHLGSLARGRFRGESGSDQPGGELGHEWRDVPEARHDAFAESCAEALWGVDEGNPEAASDAL